jgi:predicted nucleic acid-binding protein
LIVVDASLIVALILREDNVGDPGLVYDAMRATQIIAPAHWPVEIANALWANRRRGRISADNLSAAVDYLIAFKPRIDPAPSFAHVPALVQFADNEKLTVYDAIYVQLALASNARLATIDGDMRACAKRLNIPLIPA